MECSKLLPNVPRAAAAAPECSLLPGALPGSGKLILNDPAWDLACAELPVSQPQESCLGAGGCSPLIPGAAALGCGSTRVSQGICPTGGLSQVWKWLKWSSSECLIFLSAVSMQVELGAGRSSSTGCSQAGLGCSQVEQSREQDAAP